MPKKVSEKVDRLIVEAFKLQKKLYVQFGFKKT